MKPARTRFMSRGSWKDPEKVGVYVVVCLVYVLGLLAFHKTTGLMDLKRVDKSIAPKDDHVWSSQDAQTWLAMYGRSKRDVEQQSGPGGNPSPLFRHLLSANISGLNETSYGNGTNVTEKVKAAEPPTPLFPPDIFTHEQLKQVILFVRADPIKQGPPILKKFYALRTVVSLRGSGVDLINGFAPYTHLQHLAPNLYDKCQAPIFYKINPVVEGEGNRGAYYLYSQIGAFYGGFGGLL